MKFELELTYQVNYLKHDGFLSAWIVLDVEDCLEGIVDVGIGGKLMGWGTFAFVTGFPSQLSSSSINVHCSDNAITEVMAGNIRWELKVPGHFVIDGDANHNLPV